MRPRAFTLLEIVLALALLVAVMSLVGPALLRRVAPVTFDNALEQAEAAIRTAREDARRGGEVVYVYAEPPENEGDPYLIVTRATLLESASADGFAEFGAAPPGWGAVASQPPGQQPESAGSYGPMLDDEDDRTVILTLPPRIRVTTEEPEADPLGEAMAFPGGDAEFSAEGSGPESELPGFGGFLTGETEPILLAVLIPDGSIVQGDRVWLTDREGRAATLKIQAAIGRIAITPFEPAGQTAPSLDAPRSLDPERGMGGAAP